MKYRIKNPEVEKAVRGLFKTQEDFEAKLNLECEKQKHSVYRIFSIAIEPYLCVLNSDSVVSILKSDVEEVVEYDPKAWNEYSKVKPPENVWMRCEMRTIDSIRKVGAIFQDGEWRNHEGCSYRTIGWYCVRFKPWDDEEDKK